MIALLKFGASDKLTDYLLEPFQFKAAELKPGEFCQFLKLPTTSQLAT